MKKTRRRYDREFKISVVAELESGKPLAQIAREHGIHPSLPCRWRSEESDSGDSFGVSLLRLQEDHSRTSESRLCGQP